MGVDIDGMLVYGYVVKFEDIPNGEHRFETEFADDMTDKQNLTVNIGGTDFSLDDMLRGTNGYADPDEQWWYIGKSLPTDIDPNHLIKECRSIKQTVKKMYEFVMRRPPEEEPMVHAFAQVW